MHTLDVLILTDRVDYCEEELILFIAITIITLEARKHVAQLRTNPAKRRDCMCRDGMQSLDQTCSYLETGIRLAADGAID